jgi:glycosyltransferase involved in cell wall biosynthesis
MTKLICLLPVRNGEADLPGYFASVARFADGIVALDDGSTDQTRALLEAEPLVKMVLTNPVREGYAGWDDAANRNRLLESAATLEPDWLFSLDADERIPEDDAAALRAFVETDALPGFAFGFKVYRMWQDLNQHDQSGLWVYRLFPFSPGQRFPDLRLHFVPIPTDIPRDRWLRTTIRIQHLAGLTAERRAARFAKYEEADPNNAFQHSYRDLLELPTGVLPWQPRPAGQLVLDVDEADVAAAENDAFASIPARDPDQLALSAVIISRDDGPRLLPTVESVVNQECPSPFEVIVVTSGSGNAASLVRERFPEVTVIDLPRPALPGEARNAGLRAAQGEYITFPGSHIELAPGSLAGRIRAHDLGYTMVTCTTLNGNHTAAGWASYFLDHALVLPGRPSMELGAAPAHCSYRRDALLTVGGFPETMRAGEDTVVNQELVSQGHRAFFARDVTIIHRSPCRTPWKLARHHFTRGRAYGRILRDRDGVTIRSPVGAQGALLLRGLVSGRLQRTTASVEQWAGDPALIARYRRVYPLVVLGAVAAAAGACLELVRQPTPTEDFKSSPAAGSA